MADEPPINLPPETKVPAIPAKGASNFDDSIKEILEVREGVRGNPLDRGVTFRDLVNSGLAAPNPRAAGRGRIAAAQLITPSAGKQNLTVPPTPTGVTAVGAMTNIILSWNAPAYSNHAYAEIYRAEVNDYGQAVKIGMSPGTLYADAVGQGATRYYWIRFVSTANVQGAVSAGVKGQTALNPQYVMDNLLSERWKPSTGYVAFQYVRPTVDNGFLYMCIDPGISAATEPAWPIVVFGEVVDGGAKWSCVEAKERVPFMIGTVNGQPAVVIDSAYINDASISTAKIKNAFLDNLSAVHGTLVFARIEQGNIFELTIGNAIKSDTYNPGAETGFIIRRNRATADYIAEFYGDALFSGDVRAARILAGMIVGSVFGVPSDGDNGSFEFISLSGIVSDVVYGERADIRSTFDHFPYRNGGPGPTQISHPAQSNPSQIRTNPLSIISYVANDLRNYDRYRHLNVECLIAFTRNSSAPLIKAVGDNRNTLRFRLMDGNSDNAIASLALSYKKGTDITNSCYRDYGSGYGNITLQIDHNLIMTLNGVDYTVPMISFTQNVTRWVIIYSSNLFTIYGPASMEYLISYAIENAYISAQFSVHTSGNDNPVHRFLPSGFIKLKNTAFSYAVPEGISLLVDSPAINPSGQFIDGPAGLDIGFSFSSVMDNTV